ncbi:hypothetical protein [Streptomyces avicenniae]|uniref:hypothetical protein n=1 Tax=Streptomyces avicenniae TaxID=500153 RepID=UPI000AF1CF21|nr:hypothetical protein [Streptomyces avicenniae]
MPRRRPGIVRAGLPRRRTTREQPGIDGLSTGALSEIVRLERTRGYLGPGDVAAAVRLWKDHVRLSRGRSVHAYEWGGAHWYCCGDPLEARALLDTVSAAMSPRSARELRAVVSRLDARLSHGAAP